MSDRHGSLSKGCRASSSVRAAGDSQIRAESLRLDELLRSPEDVELPVCTDASHVGRRVGVTPTLSPGDVAALLQRTADPQPCPGFAYTPPGANVLTQSCYGSTPNNGFYGRGIVNAYRAVK